MSMQAENWHIPEGPTPVAQLVPNLLFQRQLHRLPPHLEHRFYFSIYAMILQTAERSCEPCVGHAWSSANDLLPKP